MIKIYEHCCPYCKKYVGLWTRDGVMIACELHEHYLLWLMGKDGVHV
jgi:hypothetical protein